MTDVGNEVENEVKREVRKEANEQKTFFPFCYYGDISCYGWVSHYDYFSRIGVLNNKVFNKYSSLLRASNLFTMIQLKRFVIVCNKPKFIKRDDNKKLHCENGKAIEWEDGYGLYKLTGITFSKKEFEAIPAMTLKDILKEQNIEKRMALMKYVGTEKLFYQLDPRPKLIDSYTKKVSCMNYKNKEVLYELYEIKGLTSKTEKLMQYICPSTNKLYFSFVLREIETVPQAMAMKEGCTEAEWKTRIWES